MALIGPNAVVVPKNAPPPWYSEIESLAKEPRPRVTARPQVFAERPEEPGVTVAGSPLIFSTDSGDQQHAGGDR